MCAKLINVIVVCSAIFVCGSFAANCEPQNEKCQIQTEIDDLKIKIELLNQKLENSNRIKPKPEVIQTIIVNQTNNAPVDYASTINGCINRLKIENYSDAVSEYNKLPNNSALVTIVPSVYGKLIGNTEKVIRFLGLLPKLNDTMYGYQLLFGDIGKDPGQLDSLQMVIWRRELTKTGSPIIFLTQEQLTNHPALVEIQHKLFRDTLLKTVGRVPWNLTVTIRNFEYSDYNLVQSKERVNGTYVLSSHLTNVTGNNPNWFLQRMNQYNYYMIKDPIGGFVIGMDIRNPQDSTGRNELAMVSKLPYISQKYWTFEPVTALGSEYFKIVSVTQKSYLMMDQPTNSTNYVYAWKSKKGRCDDRACMWKIVL